MTICAQILVRQIVNGYVVGKPAFNQIGGGTDTERFYASEDELRAAAADILTGALATAKADLAQIAAEQRTFAQRQRSLVGGNDCSDQTAGY